MKPYKNFVAGFLAAFAMIGFLAVIGFLVFRDIPEANRDFFNMALVALIGFVSTAFGYYLGGSQSNAALEKMEKKNEKQL
jgi:drug/metabolite transporter (DMT)-like permease